MLLDMFETEEYQEKWIKEFRKYRFKELDFDKYHYYNVYKYADGSPIAEQFDTKEEAKEKVILSWYSKYICTLTKDNYFDLSKG